MKKHAFLVRWRREGRTTYPVLDSYAGCDWPLGPEDMDVISARALSAMLGGYENLPDDVKKFCHAYWGMTLRLRYSNGDTTGPYIVNDESGMHDEDTLDAWLLTVTDEELGRYHHAAHKVNRLLNKKGQQRDRR